MIGRILKTRERNIYDYAFIGASPAMIARANLYISNLGIDIEKKSKDLENSFN